MARSAADNLGTHTMDTEKRFTCVSLPSDPQYANLHLSGAVLSGWRDFAPGRAKLEALQVGDTAVDDDGDTWERTA